MHIKTTHLLVSGIDLSYKIAHQDKVLQWAVL
jgi:hypothetical protein